MLDTTSGPAIATAFGLADGAVLRGPVARGEQGQVWRLEVGRLEVGRDRTAYAVKDPFIEVDPADAEADADYQDVVHAAGLPMPAPVRTPAGRAVAEIGGGPVRLYEWVDVLPRDRRLDPGEVGALLARLHRVVVPADGPLDEWYVAPVGADAWADVVRRLRDAGAPFADELDALVPEVLLVEALLRPWTARQWCHLDLWADNVRAQRGGRAESRPGVPAGGLVVLDWENSGPGHPTLELGSALFEFGAEDPARIAALHAAYVDAGGPGRITGPGDLTMVIAQTGHIGRLASERWLRSTTDPERAHHEAWLRELLDEPVTLATVERILDGVGSG